MNVSSHHTPNILPFIAFITAVITIKLHPSHVTYATAMTNKILTSTKSHRLPVASSTCVTLVIVEGLFLNQSTKEQHIACQTLDGKQYKITGIPNHLIEANRMSIARDKVELDLPDGAYLDESTATLKLPGSPAEMKFKQKGGSGNGAKGLFDRSNRSLAVTGTRSVLVVRVVATNAAPIKSEATLSNDVFGNGVDPMSMKSLYSTCSYGKLNFVPTGDRNGSSGSVVRKGATTVTVAVDIPPKPHSPKLLENLLNVVVNAAIEELNSRFSVTNPTQLANHIMFFVPFDFGGADADLGGIYSRFGVPPDGEGLWVTEAGVLAHELGHNLGMEHSSGPGADVIGREYGDHACIMGVAPKEIGPQYCFNGAKSWYLGWHDQRNYVYNATAGTWNGRLIGQVDYLNGNDKTSNVVVKLNANGFTDWYVMFNRIMSGTSMGSNKVLVVKGDVRADIAYHSFYFAELSSGESVILPLDYDYLELKVDWIELSADPAYADITIKGACVTNCGATLETWSNLAGSTIADLQAGTNNLTKPPNKVEQLGSLLESPSNIDDNYGIRVKGWLIPPVSGDYVFWIASDDDGELWLGKDQNPETKVKICQSGWASSRQWDKYSEQKSMSITLEAGNAYYYEALAKEAYGNDNLAIAWQYPGTTREVIPAKFSRTNLGGAMLETWLGIDGTTIADFMTSTSNLTKRPDKLAMVGMLGSLETPSNVDDNYGVRIKGWLVPPVTGQYEFWIASDDEGEFWLSGDDNFANKIRLCKCEWASPGWWDRTPEQNSLPVLLAAGKAYYYEAIMKEGYDNDNLAIAWAYPGQDRVPISANFSLMMKPPIFDVPRTSAPTTGKPSTRNPTTKPSTRKPTTKPSTRKPTIKPSTRKPTIKPS